MISVIHPAANHFPPMGMGPMLTAGQAAGHPVMGPYAPFKADQISSDVLYRRRGSGYTHLSNSWTNGPGVAATMKNAVSNTTSRSLSNYARPLSISGTSAVPQQPAAAPVVRRATPASSSASALASTSGHEQVKKSSSRGLIRPPAGKDFSKPLFVDCSIEYELPNAPKIPKNSLPILMIHPGYKQKMMMNKEQQCSTPNCQCKMQPQQPQAQALQPQVKKDIKAGMKRSYNTMNATASSDFYMKHLQPQNHPGMYFS